MVHDILASMYEMREELVPCFIGDPGIGKTQGIYEFAKEKGAKVVTFILSNTVPSEVSGIRMPDKDTKKLEVFDDSRMASLEDGDILFFDEILQAPPMLWAACLTLIQDRIMASGRRLPDVFIVAASNPVVSPSIIPASIRDRFQFIELEWDAGNWKRWMLRKHGLKVSNNLFGLIKGDSDAYNILTPRRATKLLLWMKNHPDAREQQDRVIMAMFDEVVASVLEDIVDDKVIPSPREQITEVVGRFMEIPDEWENLSINDLIELLKEKEEWPSIEAALAETEMQEK